MLGYGGYGGLTSYWKATNYSSINPKPQQRYNAQGCITSCDCLVYLQDTQKEKSP